MNAMLYEYRHLQKENEKFILTIFLFFFNLGYDLTLQIDQ